MAFLHLWLGPLVGAVIGYFTNYIAVRMLFRPLYPVRIGRFTLPFTPGLIPKEKARLAKTLGQTVGGTLFTSRDVENALLSEPIRRRVTESVLAVVDGDEASLRETLCSYVSVDRYYAAKENIARFAGQKTVEAANRMRLSELIAQKGMDAAEERVDGSVWQLLLTDKRRGKLQTMIETEIQRYLDEEAADTVKQAIAAELDRAETKNPGQLLEDAGVEREKLYAAVDGVYTRLVRDKAVELVERIDIGRVVQEKIDAMDVRELEKLTLSVMKKELDAIVNLGALIGFVLGLVNLAF